MDVNKHSEKILLFVGGLLSYLRYLCLFAYSGVQYLKYVHDEVYSILHYMIKFVSDLRQVGGFIRVLRFPPSNKTENHDITETLLKVALNTITLTFYS